MRYCRSIMLYKQSLKSLNQTLRDKMDAAKEHRGQSSVTCRDKDKGESKNQKWKWKHWPRQSRDDDRRKPNGLWPRSKKNSFWSLRDLNIDSSHLPTSICVHLIYCQSVVDRDRNMQCPKEYFTSKQLHYAEQEQLQGLRYLSHMALSKWTAWQAVLSSASRWSVSTNLKNSDMTERETET